MDENAIGKRIVDAAVQIHRELGPGLLERVYEVVLARELEHRGLRVERQRGLSAGCGSRVLASWRLGVGHRPEPNREGQPLR